MELRDFRGRAGPELVTKALTAGREHPQRLGRIARAEVQLHQVLVGRLAKWIKFDDLDGVLNGRYEIARLGADSREAPQAANQYRRKPLALPLDPRRLFQRKEGAPRDDRRDVGVAPRGRVIASALCSFRFVERIGGALEVQPGVRRKAQPDRPILTGEVRT